MDIDKLKKLLDSVIDKKYYIFRFDKVKSVKQLIQEKGFEFRAGNAYYELVKPEKVSVPKKLIVIDNEDDQIYIDEEARNLLGISTTESVSIIPDDIPEDKYTVFIQSKSATRRLPEDTILLYVIYRE